MRYTIDELRNKVFEKVFGVYEVFKNHFKEEYVDLQNVPDSVGFKEYLPSLTKVNDEYVVDEEGINNLINSFSGSCYDIYVWWPKVVITNEHNKSIIIKDLYAKISITIEGRIPWSYHGFLLNRATYPMIQFVSDYMHSHVNYIPTRDFSDFQSPCLGRGPIVNTITSLKANSDEVMWMLFCEELSRYVTVESLSGVPYHKLEQVGIGHEHHEYGAFTPVHNNMFNGFQCYGSDRYSTYYLEPTALKAATNKFVAYYLKHGHLSFDYKTKGFVCGMSYYDYIIDVSNCFIDYYNTELVHNQEHLDFLYRRGFLNKVFVVNNTFHKVGNNPRNENFAFYQNQHVLYFKGKDIKTRIITSREDNHQIVETTLFSHNLAMYVLESILKIINFRFKNEHNNRDTGNSPSQIGKAVLFL